MNIGLIAHDAKKKLMQNFCVAYRGILAKHTLFATGTTGRLVEEVTNLTVHKYLAGHLGGEQQLGAQIEDNDLDLVIFLRDPLQPKPHEPNVGNVLRLCDIHNIPVATNLATAELLIKSMERGEFELLDTVARADECAPYPLEVPPAAGRISGTQGRTLQLWDHRFGTDLMFVACLRKR